MAVKVTKKLFRGAPTIRGAPTPPFRTPIITSARQRVQLPGWGINGWKLFTTKHFLRIVEVKSEAEALAARLAAAMDWEKTTLGTVAAESADAASEIVRRTIGRVAGGSPAVAAGRPRSASRSTTRSASRSALGRVSKGRLNHKVAL
ncbi:hypothetical protein O988_06393 [Pseudogymnoascus sp. VKM F-3808]|nr:hypothetical protein O988_06393 [Pseudogymnoascus sp. VKM F-3808]